MRLSSALDMFAVELLRENYGYSGELWIYEPAAQQSSLTGRNRFIVIIKLKVIKAMNYKHRGILYQYQRLRQR